jgi:hypothetical protein
MLPELLYVSVSTLEHIVLLGRNEGRKEGKKKETERKKKDKMANKNYSCEYTLYNVFFLRSEICSC